MSQIIQNFINNIDWNLLRKQKEALLDVIYQGLETENMNGLRSLIGDLQDAAVDANYVSKEVVFGVAKKVNFYYYAAVNITGAASLKDAAVMALNANYDWPVSCGGYQTSWEINSCMTVDVVDSNGNEDSFSPNDLFGEEAAIIADDQAKYEVDFYFNVEVEVTNADDNHDAIEKARNEGMDGKLTATEGYSIRYYASELEPTVISESDEGDNGDGESGD